jgi:hypothetical protein
MPTLQTGLIYALAALAEIAGCFSFWAWLRLDKSAWWVAPGNRTASRASARRLKSGKLNIDRGPGSNGNGNLPVLGNDPEDAGKRVADTRRNGLVLAEQHPGRELARIAQEVDRKSVV